AAEDGLVLRAELHGGPGQLGEGDDPGGHALHPDRAVDDLHAVDRGLEPGGGDGEDLAPGIAGGALRGPPARVRDLAPAARSPAPARPSPTRPRRWPGPPPAPGRRRCPACGSGPRTPAGPGSAPGSSCP